MDRAREGPHPPVALTRRGWRSLFVRILQANKFHFEKGGSERYYFALSEALVTRGHTVVPFAMEDPRNLPTEYAGTFAPARDYDASLSLASLASFVHSRPAARRIGQLADAVRPDVAHLHNIYHQLTPSIIDALADRGIPVVMTLHDYKLVCPSYSLFAHGAFCHRCRGGRVQHALLQGCGGSRSRGALLALEAVVQRVRGVYGRVARFIAPSDYLRRVMLDSGMDPARIVHLPPFFAPNAAGGEADRACLERLPARFVAYVGRLSAEKGVDTLLAAARRVPDIPFVLFGDGPARTTLASAAPANVQFAGHVTGATLAAAYARMACGVMATRSPENAPLAVVELAAAGVPMVVTRVGGLPEMAVRLDAASVDAGDDAALAAAVRSVWSDEHAGDRARRAWVASADTFDRDRHVRAIEAIYAGVMTGVSA